MTPYNLDCLRQVTVAINTPFQEDGDVDLIACERLVHHLYDRGVRQLYVCGSTGEGFLLDNEERMAVAEAVIGAARNMRVIVHVGAPSTRHAVQLARHAEQAGADAISAVPCVYYRPGEEGVFRHWSAITQAADLPFIAYNIPQLTGVELSTTLLSRLLENPRVVGVKCSSEPAHDILRFRQAGGRGFLVFTGPDEQYLAGRIMGADAGIGGTYGAMPELYLKLEALITRGDFDSAARLQAWITGFVYRLCGFASLYGAVKAILRLEGVECGQPRLPLLPVSEKDADLIALWQEIRACIHETARW